MTYLNVDKGSLNNGLLPSVFIDEIVLDEVQGRAKENLISVRTSLSFKHISSDKRLPPWLSSKRFLRLMKIKAILVSDESVHRELLRLSSGKLTKYIFNDIEIHEVLNEMCQIQEIVVGEELRGFKKEDYQTYQLDASKHEEMMNIPFQIKFDAMGDAGSGHLSLFVFSCINLDEGKSPECRSTNKAVGGSSVGDIKIKSIIQNSKVVKESFLLRRADNNQIFLGNFHTMRDGVIMSGRAHTDNSTFLTKEKVPDLSIRDYRKFSGHNEIVDLTTPKNVFVPELDKSFVQHVRDNLDNKNKKNYFSDIWISRNQLGECNFTFAMNLKKIIFENTKFPKLLEIYPQAINLYFGLLSLKIWRQRVEDLKPRGFQHLDGEVFLGFNPGPFDSGVYEKSEGINMKGSPRSDERKLVISTENLSTAAVNSIQNSIKGLELKGSGESGVQMIAVRDRSVAQVGAGIYRYEVEVGIKDDLDSFIRNKVVDLGNSLKEMEDYYAVASQQQVQKNEGSASSGDAKPHPKNYSSKSRKFSQEFVEEMSARYKDVYKTPWWRASGVIVDAAKMMAGSRTKPPNRAFFVKMSDPRTATVESIESVIHLMQKLKTELSRLIDGAPEDASDQSKGSTPKNKLSGHGTGLASAPAPKNMINISHVFADDCFDASVVSGVGYDFLLKKDQNFEDIDQGGSIRSVTSKEFSNRVKQEREKYFTGDTIPEIKNPTQQVRNLLNLSTHEFSFLSPSRVKVEEKIDTPLLCTGLPTDANFPHKKFARAVSEIANAKTTSGQPLTDAPASVAAGSIGKGTNNPRSVQIKSQDQANAQAISKNLINILANRGCIVEKFVRPEKGRSKDKEVTKEASKDLGFKSFFSSTSSLRIQTTATNPFEERGFRKIMSGIEEVGKKDFDCDKMFLALLFNFVLADQDFKGGKANTTPSTELSIQKFDLESCAATTGQSAAGGDLSPIGLNKLPNQIKALFLSFMPNFAKFVNFSVFQADGDVFKDPLRAYVYFFNFFHLMKIEVFDGFEMLTIPISSNESSGRRDKTLIQQQSLEFKKGLNVKMPKWKLLTKKDFNNSVVNGHELLCRAMPYENLTIGVSPIPGLNLPIFDRYFLVRPPSPNKTTGPGNNLSTSEGIVANLDRAMNQIKPEFLVPSVLLDIEYSPTGYATGGSQRSSAASATRTDVTKMGSSY